MDKKTVIETLKREINCRLGRCPSKECKECEWYNEYQQLAEALQEAVKMLEPDQQEGDEGNRAPGGEWKSALRWRMPEYIAAIQDLDKRVLGIEDGDLDNGAFQEAIKSLNACQLKAAEPKLARWKKSLRYAIVNNGYECTGCGYYLSGEIDKPDYCPNCGAFMQGESDG